MTLTEDEAKVIANIRHVEAEIERKKKYSLKLLVTAFEYAQFMADGGLGNSYSTFCDEFGYDVDGEEVRSYVHESVMKLISIAREEAEL